MNKFLLIASLFVVCSFAASMTNQDMDSLWVSWKTLHGKTYTAFEETYRSKVFRQNYAYINKFNEENASPKLALNLFADLTGEEFKILHAGCGFYESDETIVRENMITKEELSFQDPPASVDWRTKGAVTPVKDQGQCGSCWSFSTTGVLEGFNFINSGTLLSFSEQQIVDCDISVDQGCNGGWPYDAIKYAASKGLEQEKDYPYKAVDGKCQYNKSKATVVNSGYKFVTPKSVNDLKTAIATMPVSILIEADQNVFQFYSSGVISSGCGASLDHAVLAVGYGSVSGSDAFIVKNSWNTSWGDKGYVYISTNASANGGKGVCGILSQPVIPTK